MINSIEFKVWKARQKKSIKSFFKKSEPFWMTLFIIFGSFGSVELNIKIGLNIGAMIHHHWAWNKSTIGFLGLLPFNINGFLMGLKLYEKEKFSSVRFFPLEPSLIPGTFYINNIILAVIGFSGMVIGVMGSVFHFLIKTIWFGLIKNVFKLIKNDFYRRIGAQIREKNKKFIEDYPEEYALLLKKNLNQKLSFSKSQKKKKNHL